MVCSSIQAPMALGWIRSQRSCQGSTGTAARIKTAVSHRALEYAKEGRDIDVEDAVAAETAGRAPPSTEMR